jgi:hypothetical protein
MKAELNNRIQARNNKSFTCMPSTEFGQLTLRIHQDTMDGKTQTYNASFKYFSVTIATEVICAQLW